MKKTIFIIFTLLITLSSCNYFKKDEKKIVAQAYDYKLYYDDLKNLIPIGISANDSILFVNNYINQWTHEKVMLHKAISNSSDFEKENELIKKQVEDYQNSLFIYEYTKKIIKQKLDSVITDQQVETYYNNHKTDFVLRNDIVQVAYVKFSKDSKNLNQIRQLLKSYTNDDAIKLRNIAEDKAVNYFLDTNTWILSDDLLKEVPIETANKTSYFKNNKYIEISDSAYIYMVRINDYKDQDSYSPLSFETNRIRAILINIRKKDLIEKMKNDIFEEAQKKGAIIIANKK